MCQIFGHSVKHVYQGKKIKLGRLSSVIAFPTFMTHCHINPRSTIESAALRDIIIHVIWYLDLLIDPIN